MSTAIASLLTDLLEPAAGSRSLELVAVEVLGGPGGRIVRVYLDRDGGIDIETIAAANEWISEALESVTELAGPYTLEVSSPGIDRILRIPGDLVRFAGQRATLHTRFAVDGRSRFTGVLAGTDGADALVDIDGTEHRVPLDAIERARLKPDLGQSGERNGRRT
jgi:ribosome maturation factor RimP